MTLEVIGILKEPVSGLPECTKHVYKQSAVTWMCAALFVLHTAAA